MDEVLPVHDVENLTDPWESLSFGPLRLDYLRDVVAVLERVPDEWFAMAPWYQDDPRCGTTACAAGHYILAHPDRGLGLGDVQGESFPFIQDDPDGECDVAIAKHFGLALDEAIHLFYPDGSERDTRKAVINRFKDFIAAKLDDILEAAAT